MLAWGIPKVFSSSSLLLCVGSLEGSRLEGGRPPDQLSDNGTDQQKWTQGLPHGEPQEFGGLFSGQSAGSRGGVPGTIAARYLLYPLSYAQTPGS